MMKAQQIVDYKPKPQLNQLKNTILRRILRLNQAFFQNIEDLIVVETSNFLLKKWLIP